MKKVVVLFLMAFLLLPVSNALASNNYTNGYFDTNSDYSANTSNVFWKDNNINVNNYLSPSNLIITLNNTRNITQYFLSNNNSDVTIKFYKGADVVYSHIQVPNPTGSYITVDSLNVDKIVLSGSSYSRLIEFDFFSTSPPEPIVAVPVTNLTENHNYNSVTLTWVNPVSQGFTGVVIKQNGLEVSQLANNTSSYTVNGLTSETSYNFEVVAKYSDGSFSTVQTITVLTDVLPVDVSPPSNISNVSVVKTHESANFLYVLPVDTDFSHLEVFRDGTLIENNLKDTSFHDFGLVANTSYVYKIVSVDIDGNKSTGYVQTVLTDIENDSLAPVSPKNVSGINASSGGRVSWSRNIESDISGYNLYVNGVKYNTSLILASNYTINGLENGTSYTITVSAVDTSGNESGQSAAVILNPSESEMPIFSSKFDLKDVADGTNNWFMSLWPILAFSVGITLAFIVARRVKLLFFA